MVTTASDFRESGVDVPLLVGGAALSERFATTRIGPAYGGPTFYAKDAMTGLRMMNELMDPASRDAALADHIYLAVEPVFEPEIATGTESRAARAAPECAPTSRFRRCRTSTAACATSPTCKSCGPT